MAPTDDDPAQQPLLAGARAVQAEVEVTAVAAGEEPSSATFRRTLGAAEAFAMLIGIVVGSGVFTSPGAIDTNVPSPGAALVVWLVGGALAWTGASTLVELGTAIPGEGGVQPYLSYVFGDVFGFLAAWTWVAAVMPATLAILSIVFVETILSATAAGGQPAGVGRKLLSVAVLALTAAANSVGTRASTRLNGFFVATKFVAIAGVVVAGLAVVVAHLAAGREDGQGADWYSRPWFAPRTTVAPDGTTIDWTRLSAWDTLGHYSAALYGALWAYSGWDKAIYISAELSEPARQLPLAIDTAIPTIIFCFITTNAAYYVLLPWNLVSASDSVAVTAITRLLGPAFGAVAAVLVCSVVAGSLLGNSFVAGRMTVAAANRGWLPRVFAVVGRLGTHTASSSSSPVTAAQAGEARQPDAPINALVLSTIIASLFVLLGDFRALLTFNGLGEYPFFFLTVVGAIVLRIREPDLRRPYKPFVLVPVVFATVSGFVVVRGAVFAPVQALVLASVWALGLGYYYLLLPKKKQQQQQADE